MITNDDVDKLKTVFATKDDLADSKDEILDKVDQSLIQFRSGIFDKLDQVIGELKTNREEREVTSHQVTDHENRLEIIESKLDLSC